MEVSTVSPPPASPTEGDDLCDIDVTNVAIHSVTLLISLCGLAGNGAVLRLLSLKDSNAGIFNLAITDFFFLLFAVSSTLLFLVEDLSCSPILPLVYVSFIFQLSLVSCYWALFQLTHISIRKDMKKLCKLCCRCDLPDHVLWVVWGAQYWAFFAVIIVIPTVTFLCPSHEQKRCQATFISLFTIILLLFAAPVVISSTINFIKAKCGSQQQQLKRRDIVILLIVFFTLLLGLWIFLQQLGFIVVSSHLFFLLMCLSSTIRPFIYFLAGRCWRHWSVCRFRESLQRVFEEPEENTPSSNDPAMDRVIPLTALLKDPGTVAEGLLEPPDR